MKDLNNIQVSLDDGRVKCILCPKECSLSKDQIGYCATRKNLDGKIVSLAYGKISAIALDPIEKKPLYHFKPGSHILSVGSFGCNLSCLFCQNHRISKEVPNMQLVSVEDLFKKVIDDKDGIGIAFTYNEPLINYEYVLETAMKIKKHNPEKSIILVTNGYINPEPLEILLDYVDGVNLDIKSMDKEFYKKICSGRLEYILRNVELINKKAHLEITNLIIGGYNDQNENIESLVKYISDIDKSIPLHFSRSFPAYRMPDIYTPESSVERAIEIGKKYLYYVYGGNMFIEDNNTYCKKCGKILIERSSFGVSINNDLESCCFENNIVY